MHEAFLQQDLLIENKLPKLCRRRFCDLKDDGMAIKAEAEAESSVIWAFGFGLWRMTLKSKRSAMAG